MNANDLLKEAVKKGASDIHITVGIPPTIRVNGQLGPINNNRLSPMDTHDIVKSLCNEIQWNTLNKRGEVDFSYSLAGIQRFRCNAYRQRNNYGIAMRIVHNDIVDYETLGLPKIVMELTKKNNGLILVTGPTGSGKSTTLASMIDMINKTTDKHIITLEDPIEYLFKHDKSIVNQREVGSDTLNFNNALRASLRQDPDVILVGEMRDHETISTALTAAETGHLVLSTLHTVGASKTIDRIIDVFPPHQQQQIRVQLAMTLQGVISQQLLIKADRNGRVPAVEVMIANTAVRNLIREGKIHQLNNIIQTSAQEGMITMDDALCDLYKRSIITREDTFKYCIDHDYVRKIIG